MKNVLLCNLLFNALKTIYILLFLSCSFLPFSCKKKEENKKLYILCTTGIIGDVVRNIVGDSAKVDWLMGSGVDPHLYKATQGDITKLKEADIIFYNGLKLEGKMINIFKKIKQTKKFVFAVAENSIPKKNLLVLNKDRTVFDPHVWFDVSLWIEVAKYISQQMQEIDKKSATYYKKNAENYILKMKKLDKEVKKQIETIPSNKKIFITSHDAFEYFGKKYDIKTIGLQGISTLSGLGLKRITEIINFIIEKNISSVFIERSVSSKFMNAVVEGCQQKGYTLKIEGNLYSDALGNKGTEEGTYIGMIQYNVKAIVNSLK